jgi:hypothetical protein
MTIPGTHAMSRRVGIGGLVSLLLAVLAVSVLAATSSSSAKRRRDPPPMTNPELELTLRAGGIDPEALAAVGVDAGATTALVARAREYLTSDIASFRAAQAQLAAARTSVDTLTRSVQSGLGGEQGPASRAQAVVTLTDATTAQQAVLTAIKTAALGNALNESQAARLGTISANRAWHVPVQYRSRAGATEAEWVNLRSAYLDARAAQHDGGSASEASAQVLAAWDADPAVSAARSNIDSLLPGVKAAWAQAISGPP